jgi:Homeodomain-like domain
MKKYVVTLSLEEREQLTAVVRKGKGAASKRLHAQLLLQADRGAEGPAWTDEAISGALAVHPTTVANVRQRCVEEGVDAALQRRAPHRQYQRKLDGGQEAHLIAVACSEPPGGQKRWTLRLLADKLVELEVVDSIARETVRQTLKKTRSSPG